MCTRRYGTSQFVYTACGICTGVRGQGAVQTHTAGVHYTYFEQLLCDPSDIAIRTYHFWNRVIVSVELYVLKHF